MLLSLLPNLTKICFGEQLPYLRFKLNLSLDQMEQAVVFCLFACLLVNRPTSEICILPFCRIHRISTKCITFLPLTFPPPPFFYFTTLRLLFSLIE